MIRSEKREYLAHKGPSERVYNVAVLRIGGFLLTGIGGAIWLLLTPPSEQFSGWNRAAPLSFLEQSCAALFLVACFVWGVYFTRTSLRSDDPPEGSAVVSLMVLVPSFYFTVRGFTRLFDRIHGNGDTLFWKLVLTGSCFLGAAAFVAMVSLKFQVNRK